jgi:Cys-rich protein (TIGR01571 family)
MTAYPAPQACADAPPSSQSYPGFSSPQPYADPYGAAPRPVDGKHPASNPQYPTPNLANSIPVPWGGAHPAVVYPMTAAHEGTPTSTNPAGDCTMRAWSVGLFDCCHHCIPNLFMVWCCPCVSLAQIYARLGISTYWTALVRFTLLVLSGAVVRFVPMGSRSSRYKRYTSVFTPSPTTSAALPSSTAQPLTGTVWYAFLLAQQVVLVATIAFARRRTRQRFQIPGNVCVDAITAFLCPCCTIAQVATHIRSYTPGSCEFTGPKNVLPPFQG